MYLQITTKCNMTCEHCCYSCNMKGKHMDNATLWRALDVAQGLGNESISIGGGEPTMHPDFFDILKTCLNSFDYVWLATNGSKTKKMRRLAAILDGTDYETPDIDEYDEICQEDKLGVALSTDYYHDPIDSKILDHWKRNAANRPSGYELRDVTKSHHGVINTGRAKRTGAGMCEDECVCSDILINPKGEIRLCGCKNAPIIGDVFSGISEKWERVLQSDNFTYSNCFNGMKRYSKAA